MLKNLGSQANAACRDGVAEMHADDYVIKGCPCDGNAIGV